jgi:serine acetyltransferase
VGIAATQSPRGSAWTTGTALVNARKAKIAMMVRRMFFFFSDSDFSLAIGLGLILDHGQTVTI